MTMKYFLVACEASGDAHGAHLIEELKKLSPGAEFQGLGGPRMAAAGLNLLQDMTLFSALGFGDVVRQYFKYLKVFNAALRSIKDWTPNAVIVIDSPAFNLRLAKKIPASTPVIYYISPQIWAWGGRRIHDIKKHIDHMMVILPFEVSIYEKISLSCEFVGHPLLDEIRIPDNREDARKILGISPNEKAVGLLAGSREKEVKRIFPIMLEAAKLLSKENPDFKFFYSKAPNLSASLYEECLSCHTDFTVPPAAIPYHEFVHAMDFALVTSGTATLETALLKTPFFLLYKTSPSTYFIGKQLVKVPFLGLVNLLAGKCVIPEFIQNEANPKVIAHEAGILLRNRDLYEKMKLEFEEVRIKLGSEGASRRAAESVLRFLKKRNTAGN